MSPTSCVFFYEAIRFRNEAMALEFDIAEHGIADILPQLTEHTLNVAHCGGFFYDNYLRPPLVDFLTPLHHLSPVERAYFCRMTQFVIRENIMSRVGVVEGTGNCMANLWNMPLAEKKETGNIYTGLRIEGKEKSLLEAVKEATTSSRSQSLTVCRLSTQLPSWRHGLSLCLPRR